MLESLINPKRSEKGPWKMFFIGMLYASLSLLLVYLFFTKDPALSKAAGMLVVLFCLMFTLPYMYFIIKRGEKEDEEAEGLLGVWKIHKDAILALMWLFLGFVVAFSFWYVILHNPHLFNFQIQTYCQINSPADINSCVSTYSSGNLTATGASVRNMQFLSVLGNNLYVMIFTLIFSLIFGAGAIFILIWNASVIAVAVGIFTKYHISEIPLGLARYMIHGFPEITAYFITALAGGMLGVGAIRHKWRSKKFLRVVENTFILLFLALIILVLAGLMEVYITPFLFK